MPFGHYTSLSASGPGVTLWYTKDGVWASDEDSRFIFQQTTIALHTAIQGLPAGYHPRVNFETIEIVPKPPYVPPVC